jgi:hypothetical protein
MHPYVSSRLVVIFSLFLAIALLPAVDDTFPFAAEPVSAAPADGNHPPVANGVILDDPDALWTNMSIHFSSNGSHDPNDGDVIRFTWDFGDDSYLSTLPNPIHVYEDPGAYTVTLTVIDQDHLFARDTVNLTILRNYGDTDIVIKAVESLRENKFRDPSPDMIYQVAVRLDGWVAYLCDLRADYEISVEIVIIGDRPADVYLFNEVDFQTYKRNPLAVIMSSEVQGYKTGVTGDFRYTFKAPDTGRYYIVIDNKDLPLGTDSEGPVDYTISIESKAPNYPPRKPQWQHLAAFLGLVCGMSVVIIAMFVLLGLLKEREKK